ncbi:MAG: retention module-containing protein, partial [Desulfatiglandales bacterium]
MAETVGTQTSSANQVVGKVFILYGKVKAISPDGTERVLSVNSPIFAFDRIVTGDDGSVAIMLDGMPPTQLDIGRMSDIVIDEDVFLAVTDEDVAEATAEAEEILEALLEGEGDIELEATAAGGSADAGGGHPTVVFELTGDEVIPGSGAETTGLTTDDVDPLEGEVEGEEPGPDEEPLPIQAGVATLTSQGSGDEDSGAVTYTVTMEVAPSVDQAFTFELTNGQVVTVTVAAGALSGSTTLAWGDFEGDAGLTGYPDPDVYLEPDFEQSVVEGTFQGVDSTVNYDELTLNDESTPVTIGDTIDTVTATLTSDGSGDEDSGSVTYTVTVDHAPQADQDFTFDLTNGQTVTVTVAAGAPSG